MARAPYEETQLERFEAHERDRVWSLGMIDKVEALRAENAALRTQRDALRTALEALRETVTQRVDGCTHWAELTCRVLTAKDALALPDPDQAVTP